VRIPPQRDTEQAQARAPFCLRQQNAAICHILCNG
jgi:hypothetical protein